MVVYCEMTRRFYPQHRQRRRQRLVFLSVGCLFIILLGLGCWFYWRRRSAPVWETWTNDSLGFSLQYPSNFVARPLSEQAKEAGYILELRRQNPNALFSVRFEEGLGPLKILGGSVFEALVAEVNRRYPDRFPDYRKEKYEEIVLANEKAGLFEFTYTGADGKTRVRQRFVLVVKDENAYYLSFQAPQKEFFKSEEDFDKIIQSFEFL